MAGSAWDPLRHHGENQFDGIAELTFRSVDDRNTWFQAAGILMDDEHNLFRKAIGYNTSPGNSKTYVDGIPVGEPNGSAGLTKMHAMVKKADGVSVAEFRRYMTDRIRPAVAKSSLALKFRMHLFEEVDASRPDAAGVAHSEPAEENYQGAFEIAFSGRLEMETFFASAEYAAATGEPGEIRETDLRVSGAKRVYIRVQWRNDTRRASAVRRSPRLIADIGATNQLRGDISSLMLGERLTHKP